MPGTGGRGEDDEPSWAIRVLRGTKAAIRRILRRIDRVAERGAAIVLRTASRTRAAAQQLKAALLPRTPKALYWLSVVLKIAKTIISTYAAYKFGQDWLHQHHLEQL